MRFSASVAGVVLCALIFIASGHIAHAETHISPSIGDQVIMSEKVYGHEFIAAVQASATKVTTPPPTLQEHVVAEGDTLTSIANQYQTTWQRVYAKNTQVVDPNVIAVGSKLIIPDSSETLQDRPLPVAPAQEIASSKPATKTASVRAATVARGSSGGNTYTAGYCTWYAKSRRPDLPNNLGNALTWVSRAAAQGIPTGAAPRAGAIGQRGNHVVYVESVNANGTVTVSEMNHVGFNIVSSRTVPASTFVYIY